MTTDLTPEAQDLVASLTSIPWQLWTAIVVIVGGSYLLARATEGYSHVTARYVADRKAEREARIAEARATENAKTLAYIGVCGASDGVLVCGRALGHDDDHADWTRDTERPVPFRVGSLGQRSLDEIRREYDRPFGGDAA